MKWEEKKSKIDKEIWNCVRQRKAYYVIYLHSALHPNVLDWSDVNRTMKRSNEKWSMVKDETASGASGRANERDLPAADLYQRRTLAKGEFSLKTLRRRRQFHNPWEIFQIYIISITHPSAIDTKRFTFWRRPIAKNKKTASARSYCKTRQTQTVDSPEMDGWNESK